MSAAERIRSRPYVWQPVPWSDQRVMTRGSVDGLPALTWGRADRGQLATVRQLRQLGLRPAGAEPVAVLVFGHRREGRRPVEYASLYRMADAAPKRTATPAQREAIDRALAARRTCHECRQEQDYYLPTNTRTCGPCSEATEGWDDHDQAAEHDHGDHGHADDGAAGDDGWWAEHEAAMAAEDAHRPITDADVTADAGVGVGARRQPAKPAPADQDGLPARCSTDSRCADSTSATTGIVDTSESTAGSVTGVEATATEPTAELTPAPQGRDETAQAVERAHQALTRLAQRRNEPDPRAIDRARSERLARWHSDDQATEQAADRAAGSHRELEGISR